MCTNFTNFAALPRRNSPSEKYIISLDEYVQCTLQNSQNTQNPKSIPCTRSFQCREKLSVASTFVPGNMARMIPSLDESLIHFGELPGYGKIPSANYTSKQRTKEALAVIIGGGRGAKTYGLESLQLENEDGNKKLSDISASHICLIISLGLFHLSTLTRPSDPSLLEFSQQMSLHLRPEIN